MSLKDIRPALREYLLGNAAVDALAGGRMYPVKLPQGQTQTSIVYNDISGQGDHTTSGPSGLVSMRMQITAWATTADAAHALFLAIKAAIDGFGPGVMGTGANEVRVQGIFIDSWRDLDDTVANLRGKAADYIIHYEER